MKSSRVLITSGEPAGIGPDLLVQIAQESWRAELVSIGDSDLLLSRAEQLKLPLQLLPFDKDAKPAPCPAGSLKLIPLSLNTPCVPGYLATENASYVLKSLELAGRAAQEKWVDALVTAPVHKGILNEAGFSFQGHTEFFAQLAGVA